jgi:hypothetical protein
MLAAVYAASYFIFVRHIRRFDKDLVKSVYVYLISLLTILVVNILSQWMTHIGYNVWDKTYDAAVCLLLLFLQFSIVHIAELVKKNMSMQTVLDKESEQHRISQENIDVINMKCHDLKHQINTLLAEDNLGERAAMLSDIQSAINSYDCMLETGNITLDVVLSEKKLQCEKEGVKLTCIADGKAISFMESMDICALAGNSISNAIEYVRTVENPENRVINFKLSRRDNIICMHVENFCDREVKYDGEFPVTTKDDKSEHGFGFKSMKAICEKYGGYFKVKVEDNLFKVDCLFSATKINATKKGKI